MRMLDAIAALDPHVLYVGCQAECFRPQDRFADGLIPGPDRLLQVRAAIADIEYLELGGHLIAIGAEIVEALPIDNNLGLLPSLRIEVFHPQSVRHLDVFALALKAPRVDRKSTRLNSSHVAI